jgi:hypothetical protein
MSSILADQQRPRIGTQLRGDGDLNLYLTYDTNEGSTWHIVMTQIDYRPVAGCECPTARI